MNATSLEEWFRSSLWVTAVMKTGQIGDREKLAACHGRSPQLSPRVTVQSGRVAWKNRLGRHRKLERFCLHRCTGRELDFLEERQHILRSEGQGTHGLCVKRSIENDDGASIVCFHQYVECRGPPRGHMHFHRLEHVNSVCCAVCVCPQSRRAQPSKFRSAPSQGMIVR